MRRPGTLVAVLLLSVVAARGGLLPPGLTACQADRTCGPGFPCRGDGDCSGGGRCIDEVCCSADACDEDQYCAAAYCGGIGDQFERWICDPPTRCDPRECSPAEVPHACCRFRPTPGTCATPSFLEACLLRSEGCGPGLPCRTRDECTWPLFCTDGVCCQEERCAEGLQCRAAFCPQRFTQPGPYPVWRCDAALICTEYQCAATDLRDTCCGDLDVASVGQCRPRATPTPTPIRLTPTPTPTRPHVSPWRCRPACDIFGNCPEATPQPCGPIFCRDRDGIWRCDERMFCDGQGCRPVVVRPNCCPPQVDQGLCVDGSCVGICRAAGQCTAIRGNLSDSMCVPMAHCFGPIPCAGDCDVSGRTVVNEAVRVVAIGLGTGELATCPIADVNGDGRVSIEEVVRAVRSVLENCR